MATYSSYKKVSEDSLEDGIFTADNLDVGAGHNYNVQWVYNARGMRCHACANNGGCVCQACGRCCQWTVPSNTSSATFEIWSGGGGAAGGGCCNCCLNHISGAGGNYAIKTIEVSPGSNYTVCAGGSWPCNKAVTTGTASMGCRSFVEGPGLDNFCTNGGCGGRTMFGAFPDRISSGCANCGVCGIYGADFGIMGTVGGVWASGYHHCHNKGSYTGQAPFVGKVQGIAANGDANCVCGCYNNWPAGGAQSGTSQFYNNDASMCCAGGAGQGGSGMVKITYS